MAWAGFGANDKPIRAHRNFRGTGRQALEFGIELRRKIADAPPDPAKHTIGSWFEKEFLPHKRALADRGDLSPTTVDALEKKYRRYIKPSSLARVLLSKLDTPQGPTYLVRWFTELSSTDGPTGHVSARTLQHAFSTLMCGLRYAMSVGPLEKDPFRKFPRELKPKVGPKGRPSQRSIGLVGQRAMRVAFDGSNMEGELTLALLGMRRGEILGVRLRGSDEDPRNGDLVLDGRSPLVRVRQVVIDAKGGARIKSCPKSETSRRDVMLPAWAVKVLREQKRRALEMRLEAGDRWEEHDLLFPSRGRHRDPRNDRLVGWGAPGRPQQPNALYKRFKKHLGQIEIEGLDRARIDAIRLHDLRHTFVSVLINEVGMRAEDVQRLAGHADLKTTVSRRGFRPRRACGGRARRAARLTPSV